MRSAVCNTVFPGYSPVVLILVRDLRPGHSGHGARPLCSLSLMLFLLYSIQNILSVSDAQIGGSPACSREHARELANCPPSVRTRCYLILLMSHGHLKRSGTRGGLPVRGVLYFSRSIHVELSFLSKKQVKLTSKTQMSVISGGRAQTPGTEDSHTAGPRTCEILNHAIAIVVIGRILFFGGSVFHFVGTRPT